MANSKKEITPEQIIQTLPSLTSYDLVKLIDEAERERQSRIDAAENETLTLKNGK